MARSGSCAALLGPQMGDPVMSRTWFTLVALIFLSLIAYTCLTRQSAIDDPSGFDISVASWPPNSADLCRIAGTNGTDPKTPEGLATRERFIALFKKRYRRHSPMMAVGLRIEPSDRIELMTPARMEPWNMDRLAVETWHETQAAFGHPFDIDLYITYIGTPPLKIGELRRSASAPNKVEIVHLARPIPTEENHSRGVVSRK